MGAATMAPDRSYEQRMAGLEKANDIRSRRAEWKRDVKAGRCSVVDALAAPPWWMGTMKLFDLLLAIPKCGRVKVGKILTACKVSPSKTVGGLSERQRGELLRLVGMGDPYRVPDREPAVTRPSSKSRPVTPPAGQTHCRHCGVKLYIATGVCGFCEGR
jgi:hypothetical protein